jgi:hypothetical protein
VHLDELLVDKEGVIQHTSLVLEAEGSVEQIDGTVRAHSLETPSLARRPAW